MVVTKLLNLLNLDVGRLIPFLLVLWKFHWGEAILRVLELYLRLLPGLRDFINLGDFDLSPLALLLDIYLRDSLETMHLISVLFLMLPC